MSTIPPLIDFNVIKSKFNSAELEFINEMKAISQKYTKHINDMDVKTSMLLNDINILLEVL